MSLKKVIREEINNDLQWIRDINPIPEIKIGTCIVDEMSGGLKGEKWVIKSIREKPSMTIIEVVNSKGKSVTLNKNYFEEDLINGRYKGCGKSIKESSELQWIKDVKSNKDIAEELFNQTVITKNRGIVKLPFTWAHEQPKKPYFKLSMKKKYGRDEDSDDIWERYKVLVNNRLKELRPENLKESNELQWIKDIEADELTVSPYISFRDDDKMRHIVKNFVDDVDDIDEDLLFNLATDLGYRWSEKHQGWWHSAERVDPKSIKESNDFDWIKDIDSKVDEETIHILYNKPFYWYSPLQKSKWVSFQGMPKIYWLEPGINSSEVKVCTHQHSKQDFYTKDCGAQSSSTVTGKFNRGVYVLQPKLIDINESKNDFGWVDEIPTYDFHNGEYYIDISQLDDDEACEIQQVIINMGIDWREGNGEIKKDFCSTFTNKGYIIRKATLYRTTKGWDEYKDILMGGNYGHITYIDGRTDLLS